MMYIHYDRHKKVGDLPYKYDYSSNIMCKCKPFEMKKHTTKLNHDCDMGWSINCKEKVIF